MDIEIWNAMADTAKRLNDGSTVKEHVSNIAVFW